MQEELNSNQFAGVTGKKEYFFTNRDVGLCKNTHIFKGVKDKVSIKSTWFQRAKNSCSTSSLIPV